MRNRFRETGADPPFGDPLRPHGVAMEGWFWRFTQPRDGTVLVALGAVNLDGDGRPWGTVGLAAHPGGATCVAVVEEALAHADGGLELGGALRSGGGRLTVTLDDDAHLDVALTDQRRWPRRGLGGIGVAQLVPGLSQYWHPWLLHARVRGHAVVAGREIDLDGASAYAEKNWSRGGFPRRWWWGQTHGFASDERACVTFAGGEAGLGPLRTTATSLVVDAGGQMLRLVRAGPAGASLQVAVDDDGWRLRGRTALGLVIEVEAHAAAGAAHLLPVPVPERRGHHEHIALQHLAGELALTVRRRGRVLFRDVSSLAGLERGLRDG